MQLVTVLPFMTMLLKMWTTLPLASNAVRSGIVGGHNAGGGDVESNGVQGSNWYLNLWFEHGIYWFDRRKSKTLWLQSSSIESTDLQKAAFMEDENEDVTIKIVYDKDTRKVLGAQMVSTHGHLYGNPYVLIGYPRRCNYWPSSIAWFVLLATL